MTRPERASRSALRLWGGVLGVLAIATRPTRVVAPRISGVVVDGVIAEAGWRERAAYVLGQSLDEARSVGDGDRLGASGG